LDYWKHVSLVEHPDEAAFWAWADGRRIHLFSSHGTRPYTQCAFAEGDVLLFGRETAGLPEALIAEWGAYFIPMTGPTRSLNLANAVAVVAYEALKRIEPHLFGG
jgi:tRNA (cytidine/uridine-2'-O-)-methyltransferase